ncbi:hypothetical protein OEA41_004138 [Lepraria neglecta]|uniref:Glycoside hydrolase family 3 N-terminal domain-containing protein n=1 Tax=Lepraria neglecta TaxID=209136 RepID=A0AAD9Z5T6_9LECA|nr:hypothetical protein OEA41_004138 [Lepraria neglecta]
MESSPVWDDICRVCGQLFMMGFDGTEVTPQIKELIEDYHLGTILLTAKNLRSAEQTTKLVLDLQTIAHKAGHPVPLAIALDQENGGVNSLFDESCIRQFPSAMGVAATGSTKMAYEVAKATAEELCSVGVNWIMGPCLDVLTNVKNQPLGVRSSGDDATEVSKYGAASLRGFKDAGIASCGKHFPSYGNLEFLGSSLDVPVITESLEQLSLSALVPFRQAIRQGVDAMMVGGCAMSSAGVNVMHACLSEQVVDNLLRIKLGFDGVVISECLEMEALSHNIGVGGGTVMAFSAGCDLVLVCRSYTGQQEAINGLKLGLENGVITEARLRRSLRRMLEIKANCTSWDKALTPAGMARLSSLQESHTELSVEAYNSSITIVRDKDGLLPLSNILDHDEEVLLLSPLLKPLPASAASQALASHGETPGSFPSDSLMSGENVFQEFGRSLARQRNGRVLHASYTANGVRPMHENLINRANAVVVITADANRNLYQYGFTKHVAMICKLTQVADKREKPLVVVSVSSPYDFAMDSSLGTYICTYDHTETALQALVKVLVGELAPSGGLPGSLRQNQKVHQSRQPWLVEGWDEARDADALDTLSSKLQQEPPVTSTSILAGCTWNAFLLSHRTIEECHFVVRNSSTKALYGFCATYFFPSTGTGALGSVFVDPERSKLSIGHSLHNRAMKSLLQKPGIKRLQLGSRLPSVFLGVPSSNNLERKRLRHWFSTIGWDTAQSRPVCSMLLTDLTSWSVSEPLVSSLKSAEIEFDLVYGLDHAESIYDLINTSSRQGIMEIYQLALADQTGSGIIRARRRNDEAVIGTVVVYNAASSWSQAIPALHHRTDDIIGGISSPVISPSVGEYSTLLQGLVLMGIKQHQRQQASAVLLDYVRPLKHYM